MLKRLFFVTMLGLTLATQFGCSPLTAGVAGAAIGAGAEHRHHERHDND